jgi:signal transduction histidine kinase
LAGWWEGSRDVLATLLAELAALRGVATLVALGAAPSDVFAETATEICRLLSADTAALGRYEPDATVTLLALETSADVGVHVGARLPLDGESTMGAVLRTGRTTRLDSFADATGTLADLSRQAGVSSAVAAPVTVEGRPWGVVVVSSRGRALPGETERRLEDITELVATAIANADGRAQLVASRARLLTAADDARRRVVRDLHDGAQQRLVQTIFTLRRVRDGDEPADALVAEALEQAERSNDELRELAHGILPSVLAHGGLRAGVKALVSRVPLPVELAVTGDRAPGEVEASAYFVVAEALTNVVKHSDAQRAQVRAWVEDSVLHVEVSDDGAGGADPEGTGLVGLSDRVTALGGELQVESPRGRGTRITATLPLLS